MNLSAELFSQNPHGDEFKVNCASCHSPEGWEIAQEYWTSIELHKPVRSKMTGMPIPVDTSKFHHNKTDFPLEGQHERTDCRSCHESLVFSEAQTDCISCHTDIHQMTVGDDCARCHNAENWLVDNITELHQENGFPLLGVHNTVSCFDCHTSETALRFDRIGNDCINCHLDEFQATTNPDHEAAGFSTNCIECHDIDNPDWQTEVVDHSFFPLTKGHEVNECAQCHVAGDFANTPSDCFACHQTDFEEAESPNHQAANFETDCASCHTTDPGWMPADYLAHDTEHFPIYSGAHEGTWSDCVDCHNNSNDYAIFSCTVCHTNPETDEAHNGISGYSYENSACLACHPTGDIDGSFDHDDTNFPLTGAHLNVECLACHSNGYAGTPTDCAACHQTDFDATINPNHGELALSTDCASCHTTEPDWTPASFANHDDYYVLNGAHAAIANDCAVCHNGDYNNTPTDCFGCHQADFDNTTDPDHTLAQFSTDCATCHTEDSWEPSTYDHDGQFFPIYSGSHNGEWGECIDCHTNPSNYAEFTCITCHQNPETDDAHVTVAGYSYDSPACLACHPTGEADDVFDHDLTAFPLTGEHINTECVACHIGGVFAGTPTDCAACHQMGFDQTVNPDHNSLGLSTDCASCHTTEPDWTPASFANHDDYYVLNGAHAAIANDCAACHNGDYNNTPTDCFGCHLEDYHQTTDPSHVDLQFSTNCIECHSEDVWSPATFDHDAQYFPIYSGSHNGEWSDCIDCHTNPSNYAEFTCITCHVNPETDDAHAGVGGYIYESTACLACHPTGDADNVFDHNNTNFPLTGAHISTECMECHTGGYTGTPTDCASCHQMDFTATTNPNHVAIGLSTDCASCHATDPGWMPASFDIHDDYYVLNGAHQTIANDCAACHNGDYNSTPSTCAGCHQADFNETTDPNHQTAQFSTSCTDCHSEDAWSPSSFDHDDIYVLNGAHANIANECALCHINDNFTNTPTSCVGCHQADFDGTTDPDHEIAQFSTNCTECHTEDEWVPSVFDHDNVYPLVGAHTDIANDCAACHINGNYSTTPNICVGCHQADFDNTTDPDHNAAQFSTDCASCHDETAWEPASFDHDAQYFPIYSGEHTGEWDQCVDCHTNPSNYAEFTCTTCHVNPETDDVHVGINGYSYDSPSCFACHPTGSAEDDFDHNNTNFPLTGAHISTDCIDCHANGYQGTPTDCASCHNDDYNQTSNPDHAGLGLSTDCASCHTTDPGWNPAEFPDHDNYYVLDGAHLDIANDCATCHNGNYNNTPNTCAGCHTPDYNASTNPDHEILSLPTDCALCHTTEPDWEPAAFPNHDDFYPLNGAHALIADDCATCHNGNYNNTPNTCFGCHEDNYNQATNPDHQAAQLPTDCLDCHTESEWSPTTFDHSIYPLDGAHETIENDCAQCHIGGNYSNTPNTCVECHQADYDLSANPDHPDLDIPTDCAMCHTSEPDWTPATFPIHDNYWPLNGAHQAIANDCASCHNGNYSNTPNTCFACHEDDFNQTTNPDHQTLQFSTDCLDCHTETAWSPSNYEHSIYPLTGAHAVIANDCALCHINGNYSNTPNTCVGCHQADYDQSTNPNHQALGLSTDCETCHATEPDWEPATFAIHDNYYVLDGAHLAVANDCAACHNGNYNNTPNTCMGCHQADYDQSTNPNHAALGIPTDCETCHTTEPDWEPAAFPIHDNYWVLDGAHLAIADDCVDCHNGDYNNTPNTCVGCHQADYDQSTNPNHNVLAIPTDCATCHTTDPDWMPATFPIHDDYWPLNGAHAMIADECIECHNGNYNNTPNTCFGCHEDDYNGTTNPNHLAAQFPTDCQDCHDENAWTPSTFDHNNIYPLTGAHQAIENDCVLCHVGGNYSNTPNDCVGCHQPDYDQSTNPNHNTLAIPTDCATCHTADPDWMPATFPIHDDYWPLNGAHAAIANDCAVCHNGNYNNTPNTCFGCHDDDYNNATNPNHASAGFPTTCEDCHDETAWVPSSFDHDAMYFPIYSGKHEGEWTLCSECHIGGNFSTFSCLDCHEHNDPAEVADDHQGVSGYQYSSPACYSCHPNGEE
ncbi:MAG: hypothetical protein AAFZ15_01255 [Bacteroidota bacterium]